MTMTKPYTAYTLTLEPLPDHIGNGWFVTVREFEGKGRKKVVKVRHHQVVEASYFTPDGKRHSIPTT
jgi:hypothetical protein